YLLCLFSCFICLGFGLITRISMSLAILVSFAYLISFLTSNLAFRIKTILLALLTLVPFVIWQLWYNYLRTGIFYRSPAQTAIYTENNTLDGNILVGITGLLLSPGKSLFVYAPLLILSVLFFRKFYKQYPKEAIYVAALTVLWFLLHSRLRSWYGAWGWGPRHFIIILPILFLPFAVYLTYILKKTALKMIAIFLGSFGFILGLCSIISNWHFRMMYAQQRGLLVKDRFVWSLWNNQLVDMLESGFGNIVRTITHAPIITIRNYSKANEYASSTINIWANSLLYAGVPWYIVMFFVTILLMLMYFSLQKILRHQPLKPSKKLTADG
ncbi:MAG: hypothetical protein PUP91_34295, partial [Rhizonema sp. PD37]|nr:hypothetical protein [Rhizonema sp. PD37]